ncbi:hypothetical protein [Nostoc sp. ChiQUE01b]|uniref:hypothetical protein n=1 Tax=Nostoc sp. ChiQUE01b TaxID=3075376 RepID=UPI002AD1DEA7|nr:hypothetical protein [Nostoc sp. ChiQUE01b]MDZ8238730.1 hypothetical protein [Nostoc sp. ChiQUE01a]MDZ8263574.1 hypothetical protein [Nostoc sp. ChiQUE01b]
MKDDQHEQLFTELTPEAAAVVEGGGSFKSTVKFDTFLTSRAFNVRSGGTIKLTSNTKSAKSNPSFAAIIRNVNTNNANGKVASVGKDTTTWTNIRGGKYVIDFRDDKDGIFVTGNIRVDYTS